MLSGKRAKYRPNCNSKLFSGHQSIITKTRKLTQLTEKLNFPMTIFRNSKKMLTLNAIDLLSNSGENYPIVPDATCFKNNYDVQPECSSV